jgi:hypothetical protein
MDSRGRAKFQNAPESLSAWPTSIKVRRQFVREHRRIAFLPAVDCRDGHLINCGAMNENQARTVDGANANRGLRISAAGHAAKQ